MSNPYSQPFPVTLAAIRKGALINELTEKLAEVVAGVVQFEKKSGKLTLTLTVRQENSEMVVIYDEVKTVVPEADRPPTWYFATDDGGLTRQNPTQDDLPFTQVKTAEEQS